MQPASRIVLGGKLHSEHQRWLHLHDFGNYECSLSSKSFSVKQDFSVLLTDNSGNMEVTPELPQGCDNENATSKHYIA